MAVIANTEEQVRGAVVAQWIRPQTLNREVPGLNLAAAAVGQGTLSS